MRKLIDIHVETIDEMIKARANILLEAYELHSIALDAHVKTNIIAELTELCDKLAANAAAAMGDKARALWRTNQKTLQRQ